MPFAESVKNNISETRTTIEKIKDDIYSFRNQSFDIWVKYHVETLKQLILKISKTGNLKISKTGEFIYSSKILGTLDLRDFWRPLPPQLQSDLIKYELTDSFENIKPTPFKSNSYSVNFSFFDFLFEDKVESQKKPSKRKQENVTMCKVKIFKVYEIFKDFIEELCETAKKENIILDNNNVFIDNKESKKLIIDLRKIVDDGFIESLTEYTKDSTTEHAKVKIIFTDDKKEKNETIKENRKNKEYNYTVKLVHDKFINYKKLLIVKTFIKDNSREKNYSYPKYELPDKEIETKVLEKLKEIYADQLDVSCFDYLSLDRPKFNSIYANIKFSYQI